MYVFCQVQTPTSVKEPCHRLPCTSVAREGNKRDNTEIHKRAIPPVIEDIELHRRLMGCWNTCPKMNRGDEAGDIFILPRPTWHRASTTVPD